MLRLERSSKDAAHWSASQYQSLVGAEDTEASTLVLVAEGKTNQAVVGFLVARHVAPEWELENIVVAPELREKGVGTRLMEGLLTHASQTNSQAVFLEVRESNAGAIFLYRKLGFQQTGRRKSYYNNPVEDAVLYCKKLEPIPISS